MLLSSYTIGTTSYNSRYKLTHITRLNGYKDGAAMKVEPYESDTFIQEMEETWEGLKPLYEQLHAYVRAKLLQK